jgi:hypothetical protein
MFNYTFIFYLLFIYIQIIISIYIFPFKVLAIVNFNHNSIVKYEVNYEQRHLISLLINFIISQQENQIRFNIKSDQIHYYKMFLHL